MTVIPVARLSASDLRSLGRNVWDACERERREAHQDAVNRSLAMHNESVQDDEWTERDS